MTSAAFFVGCDVTCFEAWFVAEHYYQVFLDYPQSSTEFDKGKFSYLAATFRNRLSVDITLSSTREITFFIFGGY